MSVKIGTFDFLEYCRNKFPNKREAGGRLFISCPFHEDNTPSMLVESDHVHCFSCGAHVMSGKFYEKIEGEKIFFDNVVVPKKQKRCYSPSISDSYLDVMTNCLLKNDGAYNYLKNRGITRQTIVERRIGYARPKIRGMKYPRIAFPAFGRQGELLNVSYRQDPRYSSFKGGLEDQKYVLLPGSSSCMYGMEYLDRYDSFVYAGGQIDSITLFQMGIPSLGALGEGSFKKEWAEELEGKDIYLLLDNDWAGISATARMKEMIPWSKVVEWPSGTEGMDVNSLYLNRKYGPITIRKMLENVGGDISEFIRPRSKQKTRVS